MRKPDILWIVTDHHAYYGHTGIQRPNFERLKEGGAFFERTYCSSPLCCPSRKTMLTGLYPARHGQINNAVKIPGDQPENYLQALQRAGYQNYYFGKWHAGGGCPADYGCAGISYPGYHNPYHQNEYLEYIKRNRLPAASMLVEKNMCEEGWIDDAKEGESYDFHHDLLNEVLAGILEGPKECHEAFYYADAAVSQLEKIHRRREEGETAPFSLRIDFFGPHQPYHPTREFVELYPPEKIPVYPSYGDLLENKPDTYQFETGRGISEKKRLKRPGSWTWADWQLILSRCYAHITLVDEAAGLILDKLDELGLTENTMVLWTSDHGDAVACHGGHTDKQAYLPEEVMRIPLAIRYPGVIPPHSVSKELISNTDLAPTVLGAAGTSFLHRTDGDNLLKLFTEPEAGWRRAVYGETYGHAYPCEGKMIAEERFKYIWTKNDIEELYDLWEDPYELNNLAGKEGYLEVLERMRRTLKDYAEHISS